MKSSISAGSCRHAQRMAYAAILFSTITGAGFSSAQTLTWDANPTVDPVQNSDGTTNALLWNTTNNLWWNGIANTSWVNSPTAIAQFGTATPVTTNAVSVTQNITLKELRFSPVSTTSVATGQQFALNGDVAGRVLDFGTDGIISLDNFSSGGSQFIGIGANLRLKSSNLRIQKIGTGSTFQYIALSMVTNPDLKGSLTIGGSVYATITQPNTVQAVDRVVVEAGGSAALGGTGLNYTQAFSLAGIGNSLSFSGTAYGAIRLTSQNITLSGPITLTADSGIHTNFTGANGLSGIISGSIGDNGSNFSFNRFTFTRGGDSTITMTGANTYGGATILGRALASYSGGITVLDFSAATAPQSNILYNGLAVPGSLVMASGNSATTLRLVGRSAQTNSQAFKDLTISGAYNVLELFSGTGGTMNMSFGALSRTDLTAALSVQGPLAGSISTSLAAGFVGPWMSFTNAYGARSWAQVVGTSQRELAGAYAGDTAYATGQSLGASPFSITSNARITSDTSGSVTAVAGVSYLGTLSSTDFRSDRVVDMAASQTLRFGTQGGIQILNGGQDLTIGTAGVASTLSAGGATANTAGVIYLSNHSSTGALTINSVIANNGTGAVTLVSYGAPGTSTVLTGANTHTGGTQIYSGLLEIRNAAALGTTGTVNVLDGATLALSGGITSTRALASVGGFGDGGNGAIRSLSGTNTLNGAITMTASSYLTADSGATLNLGGAIAGSFILTLGGPGSVNVNGAIGAVSGFVKTGLGTVVLSGANTYASAYTVNLGTLKLGTATTLPTAATLTPTSGGVVDLNGFTVSTAISMSGAGTGSGALITSSGPATLTGLVGITAATLIGGSGGDITINNAGGLTGNAPLIKIGTGTLTIISTATSSTARTTSGSTQIDAGMVRVQATAASIAPLGTSAYALNGGTLSLGMDATSVYTNIVNVITSSTIIADRASSGIGGTTITLGNLTMSGNTLTVKAGTNVTSGTVGLVLGTVSIGGAAMRPGNPTFDVQSTSSATLLLTLGQLSDQGIAPRTITFQNSGTTPSAITLGTAGSLVDGTKINLLSTGGAVVLNLTNVTALGTLAQVTVGPGNTLTLGATQTVAALSGVGTVNASGAFALTIGNATSATTLDSSFSGVLANGTGTLALTKAGKGILTLGGSTANTHTGITTVTGGTLVLAKTGGATAIGGALTIGLAAANTGGNATVRLDADEQMIVSAADVNNLTINAGGTLDMNGHTLTVNTLSAFFGGTVRGPGTLLINRVGGTIVFTGTNTIASTLQLTTSASGATATRTIQVSGVADQLTLGGAVTENAGNVGLINKTLAGTLILSGDNSYSGTTTLTGGMINIRHGNALGATSGGTTVLSGATLQIQGGITTAAEPLTLTGTGFVGAAGIGFQTGAFVNVSGINNYAGPITLAAAATISSDRGTLNLTSISGTFALTLAGAGDGSIAGVIGNGTGGLVKNGAGTWTLAGVNTGTGTITINAGTLKLGSGSTGSWSGGGLTFTGSGIFEFGGSTAASVQGLAALTLTSGAGTLQVDAPATGINGLTFTSLTAPAAGSALNIVSPANTSVTISGTSSVNGIVNARLYYNGADFAASTAGLISAAATTTATSSLTAGNTLPYLIGGSFSQSSSIIASAGLKFTGSDTLTLNNSILLTINNGTNTAGGLLVTGGVSAVISNQGTATGLTTGGSGDLVIRTNTPGDSLDIQTPITSTTTGGLTKNGAGTLTLSAANAYTGPTSINEGTVILGGPTALSSSVVTVQVSGVLNLNGQTAANAVTLNGTGISSGGALINNLGSATVGAITVGTGLGTGGIGASVGGTGNITSTGALAGNNLLVKTGSGTLTVGTNGAAAMPSTRTGSTRIDAGTLRISNSTTGLGAATAQLILNGGTLSLGTTASVAAYPMAVTASSGIITDAFTAGAGLTHTLGTLIIGNHTLTISAGSNVTAASTTAAVTFGATTLQGSPVFDVQSPVTSTGGSTVLTLGALNDLGVAQTISFTNTGTSTTNSQVTLATAMTSLIEGTSVNLTGRVTLNLNLLNALGTLTRVSLDGSSVLNVGASTGIASLTGSGTVSAGGAATLTIGNNNSPTPLDTTFTGSLVNGTGTLSLTKGGLGTLTLSPTTATYTGTTTVTSGILKLGNSIALGGSNVVINGGGTVDLNGQTTNGNFTTIIGTGHDGGGAIINSSTTTGVITGTTVMGSVVKIGGAGNITVNNAGGLTGSALLTKVGPGTLAFISTSTSARSATVQIDEGTLRLQGLTAVAPVGLGATALNGGTLSLGFDTSGTVGGAVNLLADSTLIVDRATAGSGGHTLTMGAMVVAGNKLTIKAGDNVTGGTIGLTMTTVSIGSPSLAPGNPVFDVQGTAGASLSLTLGALTDQAIAARIITFQNSGAGPSAVTLSATATSLVNGTLINLAGTGNAVTLNLNASAAIGTTSKVSMAAGNTLALGTSQTINALNGGGTVSATANSTLTIGNPVAYTVENSAFDGDFSGSLLSVVKSGYGTLILGGQTSNSFSGPNGLAVNSGIVVLAKAGGAVAVPTKLTIGTVGAASGSATVRLAGAGQIASTATVVMNPQAFLDMNGNNAALGMVIGTPGSTVMNNANGTNAVLSVGAGDVNGGHLGAIVDNSSGTATVAFIKTGTGSFTMGGLNTYSGATQVLGGSLQVGVTGMGSTGLGAVTLAGGTSLLGTGIVQGSSFTAASGSTLYAGDGTLQGNFGTLSFKPASGSGTFDFQAGSTVVLGISPGGVSDMLTFTGTGTNTLLFNSNLAVTAPGFVPTTAETFKLLDWSGLGSSPEFATRFTSAGTLLGNGDEAPGLDLPDISGSGYGWDISSFMANGTVSIIYVPEPSRVLLLGVALGLLLGRRRR